MNPSSPLNGRSKIALDLLPAIVGRDPDCDICLRDPCLSRLHCEIDEISGRLVVRDLESRNGTFVNGCKVGFAHLSPGDKLRLGRTRLVVEPGCRVLRVLLTREAILQDDFGSR